MPYATLGPDFVSAAFKILLTVVAALAALNLVSHQLDRRRNSGHLSDSMVARFRLVARWTIVPLAFLLVLQHSGAFQQAWAVLSAALAALAVGFVANWSVLSSSTVAVLVLIYKPYRIGDTIEVVDTNGTSLITGTLTDLNLMFTTIEQNGKLTRIPNNLLLQKYVRLWKDEQDSREEKPFFESLETRDLAKKRDLASQLPKTKRANARVSTGHAKQNPFGLRTRN